MTTALDARAPWTRRDEFLQSGIPADVYRQQIALAHRLRSEALGRVINRVAAAIRRAAGSGAQRVQHEKRPQQRDAEYCA